MPSTKYKKRETQETQENPKSEGKTEAKPRKYPHLSEQMERAIIAKAMGYTNKRIAEALNKSEYTVIDWFRLPEMKAALEQENLDIIANERDSYGKIVEMAYKAIREKIQDDPSLAFAFLKETGHLPKSSDKAEKERIAEEIFKRMSNALEA